ncbi:hypothetical protein LISE100100_00405 [Listeria seeligeri]|uniref:hypothetical protein n=1 Tax=Listeria seeligeri TaxID=1640 RepID=UPI0001C4EC43|nr:hypothetical protein [Listeria seeligeri]CBH27743.1 hypothetical protein lse_1592 [Listeria seeligeri serovar 1/2b str. SLCC3954]
MQEAAQKLFDELIKDDRIFLILFLVAIGFIVWAVVVLQRRQFKMADRLEARAEEKQITNTKMASMLEKAQIELTRSQVINEKNVEINKQLVEVTKQQQKYIENEKTHRNIMLGMDEKINTVLLELAKK